MPIAQLLELWKKIEVEPMEIETAEEELNLDSEPAAEEAAEEGKCDSASLPARSAAPTEVLEKCTEAGLTKSIGMSNCNRRQLEMMLKKPALKHKPVCNQAPC
ncbi:uncharacterized protein RBU33_004785 isoform 4-T4 [Hipposideros larvatus]